MYCCLNTTVFSPIFWCLMSFWKCYVFRCLTVGFLKRALLSATSRTFLTVSDGNAATRQNSVNSFPIWCGPEFKHALCLCMRACWFARVHRTIVCDVVFLLIVFQMLDDFGKVRNWITTGTPQRRQWMNYVRHSRSTDANNVISVHVNGKVNILADCLGQL